MHTQLKSLDLLLKPPYVIPTLLITFFRLISSFLNPNPQQHYSNELEKDEPNEQRTEDVKDCFNNDVTQRRVPHTFGGGVPTPVLPATHPPQTAGHRGTRLMLALLDAPTSFTIPWIPPRPRHQQARVRSTINNSFHQSDIFVYRTY